MARLEKKGGWKLSPILHIGQSNWPLLCQGKLPLGNFAFLENQLVSQFSIFNYHWPKDRPFQKTDRVIVFDRIFSIFSFFKVSNPVIWSDIVCMKRPLKTFSSLSAFSEHLFWSKLQLLMLVRKWLKKTWKLTRNLFVKYPKGNKQATTTNSQRKGQFFDSEISFSRKPKELDLNMYCDIFY